MEPIFEETWFHADLSNGQATAPLDPDESFHFLKVLRLKPGRRIIVTNGMGKVYLCGTRATGKDIEVEALETVLASQEPPSLHYVLPILKGRETEEPVEGLCQVPVAAIHLVTTERSMTFKGQDHARMVERLRQKSRSCLKQAKKAWVTEIFPPGPLRDWRRSHPGPLLVVNPGPDRIPWSAPNRLYVLSGPEGGLSPAELDDFLQQDDCGTLGLGNSRLRATHAPLLAVGKLMGMGLA